LVKPLVWSINVPMINGAWVDLFERLVGPLAIDPMSLARQFHFRAYFNMSGMGELFRKLGLAEDTLERLLGLVASDRGEAVGFRWKMLVHLPRIVRFMISVFFFHRRASTWVHHATAQLEEKETALAKAGNLKNLLAWSDDMLRLMRDAAQRRIVALLLHMVIGQLGQKALQRHGISDLSQLEMPAPDLDSLDPTIAIRQLAHSFANLPDAERQAGVEGSTDEFLKRPRVESFAHEFQGFLQQFGHLSESGNDFSARPWEEDPAVVLQMVIAQAASGASGALERDPSQGNWMAKRWARRVTKRRIDRERVGAIFSQGFYVLHRWTQELERSLEGTGIIKEAGDVFFLRLEELRCLADSGLSASEAMERIARRKAEMAASASLSLPDQILGDRILGEAVSVEAADEFRGIGVSRGIYEGTVSVIRSLEESQQFRAGDVLVVPFSDVAWTPLFSRAGAIIAESGGVLSHSAIIARELKIPAVVSVSSACDLPDGARVRVDGLDGRVTRLESA
jgi:pyruvate,water dikinase